MITTVPLTGSTNADLLARLSDGELVPEGDWLVADRQDAGRGRLGRVWNDGAGNFMGSTVVHPGPQDPAAHTLALMAGLALHEALGGAMRAQALRAFLKWPNDLFVGESKVAGILLEARHSAVVVGIGVNLVSAPALADRPAAALSDYGVTLDRDEFAQALAGAFTTELHRWRTAGIAPMLRRWQSAAHPVGTRLRVLPPGEDAMDGSFAGLTEDGNLRLALADGTIRTIHAGDVLLP